MSLLEKLRARKIKHLEQKLNKLYEKEDQEQQNQEDFVSEHSALSADECIDAWDKVTKLTEDLNNAPWAWNFRMYVDTTKLAPGVIVYVIGKRQPTDKKPYVTYKPEPRVVSSIHDNGVNGGTVFFTFTHKIENPQSITKSEKDFNVVSDEDAIYSPLTKDHAEYICKLLNLQSKRLYEKHLLKIQQQQIIK